MNLCRILGHRWTAQGHKLGRRWAGNIACYQPVTCSRCGAGLEPIKRWANVE